LIQIILTITRSSFLLLGKGLQLEPFEEDSEDQETENNQTQHHRLLVNELLRKVIRNFDVFARSDAVEVGDYVCGSSVEIQISLTGCHFQRSFIIFVASDVQLHIMSSFWQNYFNCELLGQNLLEGVLQLDVFQLIFVTIMKKMVICVEVVTELPV
jgi:hypothetical protein